MKDNGMGSDGTRMWSPSGELRPVLVPAETDVDELARIFVVGTHFLTKREWEIAKLLAKGKTRKEMADVLNCSDDIVSATLVELYRKLRVQNEKQACVLLGRYGAGGHDK